MENENNTGGRHQEYGEISLAADLYIEAVKHNLPSLLRHGDQYAPTESLQNLNGAFRAMSLKLTDDEVGIIGKEPNGPWFVNDEKVQNISENNAKDIVDLYNKTIVAHGPVLGQIMNSGRSEYVNYFNDLHSPVEFVAEDNIETVMTDDSKRSVIGASLTLLKAINEDPANAAFLTGVAEDDISSLRTALSNAHYLLPENAPADRTKPIGEQNLRGTPQQQSEIIDCATVVASNVQIADTIPHGNAPMMTAHLLKQSFELAEFEEIEIPAPRLLYSDIKEEDAELMLQHIEAMHSISSGAYEDDNTPSFAYIRKGAIKDVKRTLDAVKGNFVYDRITDLDPNKKDRKSKELWTPNMGNPEGEKILAVYKAYDDLMATRAQSRDLREDSLSVFSDADGAAHSGPNASEFDDSEQADYLDQEYAFDKENSLDQGQNDDPENSENEDDEQEYIQNFDAEEGSSARQRELETRADALLVDDDEIKVAVNKEKFYEFMDKLQNLIEGDVFIKLEALANRDPQTSNEHLYRSIAPTFAAAQERTHSTAFINIVSDRDAISHRRFEENHELKGWELQDTNRKDRLIGQKYIEVHPDRGFLKGMGYKEPSSEAAPTYIPNFVRAKMLNEDGTPNLNLRTALILMSSDMRAAKANNQESGVAWKQVAVEFREYEEERRSLEKEVKESKAGKTTADFDHDAVKLFTDTYFASGSDTPARMKITPAGKVTISHPDAGMITSQMNKVPDEISKHTKGRTLGSMVDVMTLRNALEATSDKNSISAVITGEQYQGAVPTAAVTNTKVKEPVRYPDIALS